MSVFVQLGAGAGDRDSRLNYRDGFTELVKSKSKSEISRILLVEPNPLNIKDLIECWKDYPQAEIYNIGISPIRYENKCVGFFYTEKDAPNYQVTTMYPERIRVAYGNDIELKHFFTGCMNINEFHKLFLRKTETISMYAIDIEGADADIILDMDMSLIDCENISFECISLSHQEKDVLKKMRESGFIFNGRGLDINGYDWMFTRDHSSVGRANA